MKSYIIVEYKDKFSSKKISSDDILTTTVPGENIIYAKDIDGYSYGNINLASLNITNLQESYTVTFYYNRSTTTSTDLSKLLNSINQNESTPEIESQENLPRVLTSTILDVNSLGTYTNVYDLFKEIHKFVNLNKEYISIYFPIGKYNLNVTSPIPITLTNIILDFNNSTFYITSDKNKDYVAFLINSSDLIIKNLNLKFVDQDSFGYTTTGISICNSIDITFENCNFYNFHNSALILNNEINASTIKLINCTFSNNRIGLYTYHSKNLNINNCNFKNYQYDVIIESCEDLLIDENTFFNNLSFFEEILKCKISKNSFFNSKLGMKCYYNDILFSFNTYSDSYISLIILENETFTPNPIFRNERLLNTNISTNSKEKINLL